MAKVSNFEAMLSASSKEIIGKRSKLLSETAKRAQENVVREVEDRLIDANTKLLDLTDIHKESKLSLLVAKKDFDPKTWVKEVQELKVERANILVEYELAVETYEEFFTSEGETYARIDK